MADTKDYQRRERPTAAERTAHRATQDKEAEVARREHTTAQAKKIQNMERLRALRGAR